MNLLVRDTCVVVSLQLIASCSFLYVYPCSCALIYKGPGGIKVAINLISSDIILVDHLTLLLMGSTGKHLEVNISLKVLR